MLSKEKIQIFVVFNNFKIHKVYWLKDVEAKAVQKWGSLEKVKVC